MRLTLSRTRTNEEIILTANVFHAGFMELNLLTATALVFPATSARAWIISSNLVSVSFRSRPFRFGGFTAVA